MATTRKTRGKKRRKIHLPATSVDRLRRNHRVQDLELGVTDGLVAERALPATPLETLHDALAASVQAVLVHLRSRCFCFACVCGSECRCERKQRSDYIAG